MMIIAAGTASLWYGYLAALHVSFG